MPPVFEQLRMVITQESFLIIEGPVQNTDNVVMLKPRHVEALRRNPLVGGSSHGFH